MLRFDVTYIHFFLVTVISKLEIFASFAIP